MSRSYRKRRVSVSDEDEVGQGEGIGGEEGDKETEEDVV